MPNVSRLESPPQNGAKAADHDWLELAMQAADMGACSWDIETDRLYVSERAARILGSAATGGMAAKGGERMFSFTHPEDLERVRDAIMGSVRSGEPYKIEHRSMRVDTGAVAWVLSAGTPVRDASGKVVKLLGVLQDITERKLEEAHRETLMADLDHRVKNVLASVQSMALQSARKAVSLEGFMKTFAGRLKAMVSAQALLATTRWQGAELRHLLSAELGGVAPGQTRWEGPDIALTPRATSAMALALHELATNAVKYGALSTDTGRVDVRWRRNKRGGFDLEWVESGGPKVPPPTREGFGATLLSRVTGRELGGEAQLAFQPGGVIARLTSDASAISREGPAPLEEPPQAAPKPAVSEAPAGYPAAASLKGLRVLIVEDSLLLSIELENALTEAGAIVAGLAADVPEALALIGDNIDAAILDADLNGVPVTPVAEALVLRKIPFVFATGYGEKLMAPQGFDAPYVRKPYDLGALAAALARATGRA